MENFSPVIAFVAGLLSFLSPCVLPLVPVYLGSLAGPEVFAAEARKMRMPVFWHSLSFVIGFTIVFIIMGVGAGLAGFVISSHIAIIRQIAGGLLVLFGLFLLLAQKIPWLNYERRLAPSHSITTGYLRSLITGGIFSFAWTPCVGPILGSILALAWSSETIWRSAYLLALYSLGLGVPFLIIGAAFDSVIPWLKRLQRYSTAIYIFSGALLIVVGILILTNRLFWL